MALKSVTIIYDDCHMHSTRQNLRFVLQNWAVIGICTEEDVWSISTHLQGGCGDCAEAYKMMQSSQYGKVGKHSLEWKEIHDARKGSSNSCPT